MATKRASKKAPAKPTNVVAQARGKGKPRVSTGRWLWENIKSLGGAVLIYLFIKTFFVEAFRIPSGSMIPTLLIGDWLFVNKAAYGPALPFSSTHLPGYTNPKRGDVVVFISPYQADEAQNGNDPTPTLVKRLIGMGGDTIYMRSGLVYINGLPQRQGYAASTNWKGDGSISHPDMDWQHKYELKRSRFGSAPSQPTLDNWGPLVIPTDHYFMMGDNRYCSKDSRYWGVVPHQNVRGKPMFVYYSYVPGAGEGDDPNCNGVTSDRPLPFITDIRWSRIGHWIR